ncbi:uncharacterized protein LOC131888033 [Tigriopus californicus]|uniref:uncharacterized protein LOC131888033 n=1 Tax=Tigriopus californicus TaxID=6832 RepID=UPI0027D9F228|nr:uncharacterized protein LOC131888033 [Tigriopus californicus]
MPPDRKTLDKMDKASEEDNFKVCGLCSQLVDESVQLNAKLRSFLLHYLSLTSNASLPTKICTDCYQGAFDSLNFRDRCMKAILKLKSNRISDAMILGKSIEDKKAIEAMDLPVPPLVQPRAIGSDFSFEARQKAVSMTNGRANSAIIISENDKILADQALRSPLGTISYRKKKSTIPPRPMPPMPAKKGVATKPISQSGSRFVPAEPATVPHAKPEGGTVSAYGRVRKPLAKGYVYTEDFEEPEESVPTPAPVQTPRPVPPAPRPRGRPPKSAVANKRPISPDMYQPNNKRPKTTSKPASAPPAEKKRKKKIGPKGSYYYVGENGKANDSLVEVDEDESADEEEIFPSIGPYQCEICQDITNTKQEFVDHIKRLHRNIVDEEVLKSLENDLKKSKKAQERKAKAALNAKAQFGGPSPNTSKSKIPPTKKTTRVPDVQQSCEFCGTVLPHPRDVARHRKTPSCIKMQRKLARAKKAEGAAAQASNSTAFAPTSSKAMSSSKLEDISKAKANKTAPSPLADDPGLPARPGASANAGNAHQKTHYKPKAKVAKQYEMEKGITSRGPSMSLAQPISSTTKSSLTTTSKPATSVPQKMFQTTSQKSTNLIPKANGSTSEVFISSSTAPTTTTTIVINTSDGGNLHPEHFTSSVTEEPVTFNMGTNNAHLIYQDSKVASAASHFKHPTVQQTLCQPVVEKHTLPNLSTAVWEEPILSSSTMSMGNSTVTTTLDLSALETVSSSHSLSHPVILNSNHHHVVVSDVNPYGMIQTPPSSNQQTLQNFPHIFF